MSCALITVASPSRTTRFPFRRAAPRPIRYPHRRWNLTLTNSLCPCVDTYSSCSQPLTRLLYHKGKTCQSQTNPDLWFLSIEFPTLLITRRGILGCVKLMVPKHKRQVNGVRVHGNLRGGHKGINGVGSRDGSSVKSWGGINVRDY